MKLAQLDDWTYYSDTPSYVELQEEVPTTYAAYCNSWKCTQAKKNISSKGVIKVNVSSLATDCPDCRCAIMWKAVRNPKGAKYE
jgi:hypothetical protein